MIYWTDSKSKAIVRCSMNGTDQETVLTSQKKPKALVLDPIDRFVFWSTSGKAERIYRADFDGATRELIVREELELVVSLDVDIIDKRIYWLDQGRGKIESVNYQGSYRTVLVSGIRTEATGLSLLADSIYWLGTNPPSVHRADIRTGRRQIRLRSNYFLSGQNNIVVMHQNKQPTSQQYFLMQTFNVSKTRKGATFLTDDQSHNLALKLIMACYIHCGFDLCFITVTVRPGIAATIFRNKNESQPTNHFVLFTTNNTVRKITKMAVITTTSSPKTFTISSVDYDPRVGKIFFADAGRGVIESANLDVHTVARYGSWPITGVFQPRGITVYPALNWIYWTDIAEGASKIVASLHDGTYRRDIIDENLFYPNSITIDFVQNKLLWVDYGLSVIEQSSLEGFHRKVLFRLAESGHANIQPHSLEVFDKFIWYTNWEDDMLVRLDHRNHHTMDILGDDLWHPTGIKAVDPRRRRMPNNPCESGDAVCGDNAFCLSDRSGGYTCICNKGYEHDLNYGCVEIQVPLLGPVLVTIPNRPTEPTTTPVKTTTKEAATTLSSPETTTIEQVNKTTTEGATTTTFRSTTMEDHLAACPISHTDYCTNGGSCKWITALDLPSCTCTPQYTGVRCRHTRTLISRFLDNPVAVAVSGGVLLPICCILSLLAGCFLCRRLSTGSCKSNNSPTNCHPDGRVSTDLFLRRSTSYHQRGEHIDNPVYHPPRNNIQMQTIDRSSFHLAEPRTTEQFSTFPRRAPPVQSTNNNNAADATTTTTTNDVTSTCQSLPRDQQLHEETNKLSSGYEDMSRGNKPSSRKDTSSYISMDDSSTEGHEYSSTIAKHYSQTRI
ncbi:putative low-density lipoprotein receptor-related protein 4 [Apostichopus japonicus]|uniref:Putative low-density lipoprotein receptor-related protein 4 n=1 Tax=Stichopus japonicus TaxID=307972 RepID=A0A2G8JKD6_STIJA|nr:putative low-density lipoprotein receptor-related protein 4 [Apostichopus japonicus]